MQQDYLVKVAFTFAIEHPHKRRNRFRNIFIVSDAVMIY